MRSYFIAMLILFCVTFLFNETIAAQKLKKMKWKTELCEVEATYDSSKYTEAQLRNTHTLMYSLSAIPLSARTSAYKIEDIGKFGVEELDLEYKQKIEKLKNLDIVKDDFWEQKRQKQILVTEQFYKLARFKIQGYTNPKILLQADKVGDCREKYAKPLAAGGDSLLEAWQKLNVIIKAKNGDPDRIQKEFDLQFNSPDKFKFAIIQVTTFGWWNCVNDKIDYVVLDEVAQKNFDKLFKKIKQYNCDEP